MVRLTKRGQEEFAAQAAAHEAWIDEMLGGFSPEECAELSERLDFEVGKLGSDVVMDFVVIFDEANALVA